MKRPRGTHKRTESERYAALASSCGAVRSGKKVVTVYLPESVWRDAKMLAVRTDATIDAIMRRGLDVVFAEHGVIRGA